MVVLVCLVSWKCRRTKNRRPRIHGDRQRDRVVVDLSSRKSKLETIEVPPGVLDGRFMLSPEKVAALQRQYNLSEDELLEVLITPASQQARPPISSFHVGAAGLADSGAVYIGCNLEFANLPLYNSVHAEQFLLVNALHHGERGIKKIAVSAAPCGHCRQFFSELNCANSIRFSFSGGSYSLGQLLPKRFGPLDLLMDRNSPLLLDPQDNHLELVPEARDYLDSLADNISKSTLRKAAEAAFNESRHSYSPYSRSPAGVAIVTEDEEVYSGHYIECAAYNPSLPPLQTAIIDAIIDGMPTYAIVRHVVLVEVENAPVQHAGTVRVVLEQIAPEAELQVLYAQWAAE